MKILITGGASGLGKAITEKLAANAENVVYFTFNLAKESAGLLESRYQNATAIHLDFHSTESINTVLQLISEVKPDVLINNAITGYLQNHFHKINDLLFLESFKLNVHPVLMITQRFISESRKKKFGKIITILTSYLINKSPIGFSEYVANKAYLQSMVKSWANENAAFGITSNSISPSFMRTNFTNTTDDRLIENMINENPNKQLLKEEEVADAVSFFISSTAQINGANLIINAAENIV